MLNEIGLINYPVTDMEAAKKWYEAMMGVAPYIDTPQYVGFHGSMHDIGLNPNGYAQGMKGPVIFWKVDDIHAAFEQAKNAGARISQEPQQLGPQLLGSLVDPDGIMFGFVQSLNASQE